jgi:acetyl-CoA carboxylase biotin carboxyl carrier protein
MIDFGFLRRLLDLLNESNAQTIEIRRFFTTVRISKGGMTGGPVTYDVSASPAMRESSAPPAPAPSRGGDGGGAEGAGDSRPPANLTEIKSPMVGTYYAQPEPGADPYVRVGTRIRPGQTLCIIEAMKIMNPLDAEVSGVVREVCIEDAQPVEFGQVLFRVDPHG